MIVTSVPTQQQQKFKTWMYVTGENWKVTLLFEHPSYFALVLQSLCVSGQRYCIFLSPCIFLYLYVLRVHSEKWIVITTIHIWPLHIFFSSNENVAFLIMKICDLFGTAFQQYKIVIRTTVLPLIASIREPACSEMLRKGRSKIYSVSYSFFSDISLRILFNHLFFYLLFN